jgi:dienelactone hydrolase
MKKTFPFMALLAAALLAWTFCTLSANAQVAENSEGKSIPPSGIEIAPADRADLERGLASLESVINELKKTPAAKIVGQLPDVQVYAQAVRTALDHREFFAASDVVHAKELIEEGRKRAEQMKQGEMPWTKTTGLVVRGYVSRIDGSVQPYGLVVPETYQVAGNSKFRLDVWLHGRNEKLSEVNFIDERRKKAGLITPEDTIVLHPYGRYCNAFKFAGEIDVLEAIEAVKKQYRIDPDRIAMRGFSMGGAGCWHLAVHYPAHWMVAAPGAGFAETEQYLKMRESDLDDLPQWQKKLFHLYDCPDWATNLYHCPTIAYSGEDDPQKQSADVMEKALAEEGIALRRVIGPATKHQYHPESKQIIEDAITSIADAGGRDRNPAAIHFVTYTLRYSRAAWAQLDGLAEHWQQARIDAEMPSTGELTADTKNVTDMTFSFPPGWAPFDVASEVLMTIDGEELTALRVLSDRSWTCHLYRDDQGQWQVGQREEKELRKRPGLQGPIDDAFMDSFIMVRPTGKSPRAATAKWVEAEMNRAIRSWRSLFRGDARVKDDSAITDSDIASSNLILWGDPQSNAMIARIADKLPIRWQGSELTAGGEKYDANNHIVLMIYPNPLNPKRYIVLNSGFTFREADNSSNARQVPRLPDWAIVDVRTPPDSTKPGKIVAADFFGEKWELHPTAKSDDRHTAAVHYRK